MPEIFEPTKFKACYYSLYMTQILLKHIWNLSTLSFVNSLIATHWLLSIELTGNIIISRNKTPGTQAGQQQKLDKKFPVTPLISDHSHCNLTDASHYISLKHNMLSKVIQGYVYACDNICTYWLWCCTPVQAHLPVCITSVWLHVLSCNGCVQMSPCWFIKIPSHWASAETL